MLRCPMTICDMLFYRYSFRPRQMAFVILDSPFHALLSKLLYAKRVLSSSKTEKAQLRPPLEFNPEEVVKQSGMTLFSSIYFLHGHAPNFFTAVNNLTFAFDTYSGASYLISQHGGALPTCGFTK